jgi:hypothetical protein
VEQRVAGTFFIIDPAGFFAAWAIRMAGMHIQSNQFSIRRMLLAIIWIGLGLAIWEAGSPFDLKHFLDDDPDNIRPRIFAAFFMVPLAGAAGSLRGRPIVFAAKAFFAWLVVCVLICTLGIARLL